MLNKRVKTLEKRLADLEEFLGVVYTLDDGYGNYSYKLNAYRTDVELVGELGQLKQDYANRKKVEQPKK